MIVLGILYHVLQTRRATPRCPYFRQAKPVGGAVQGQCTVSANPVTDPRMATAFNPKVCVSTQHKLCPTYRAAKSGREAA
jgi:hypothetical protein